MNEVLFIIYVKNQAISTEFYQQLFQLKPTLFEPGMTEFKLSENITLGIMPENGMAKIISHTLPHPSKGNGIPRCEIYLRVNEPEDYMNRGIRLGGKEISKVQHRNWGEEVGYISDQDGHIVAFARK